MAQVFKFRWDTTDLVLTAAADSGLRFQSWRPRAGTPGRGADAPPVIEVIDLKIDRASHDNLATSMQALELMRVYASRYMHDATFGTPVWLHASMTNETGERRALVRRIDMEWRSEQMTASGPPGSNEVLLRLYVEREPWWETTAERTFPEKSEASGAALIYDHTGAGLVQAAHDIVGDVPARAGGFRIYTDGSGVQVGRLWMGWRSTTKHPAIANFVPIWECEDGTAGTDAAHATDGGNTASPIDGAGNDHTEVTPDPGTPGWAERLAFKLSDITANYDDNFGDFLWLLRAKVDAACTWEIQLRWGYDALPDDDHVRGPIVEISNTSWDFLEQGRMVIPLRNLQVYVSSVWADSLDQDYDVQVWARRTAGSAGDSLFLDCLCLIPLDEGWAKSWDFDMAADSLTSWWFGESPKGTMQALCGTATSFTYFASLAASQFRPPIGDGRLIIVYAAPSSSDITLGIWINPTDDGSLAERWTSLRGSQ